MNASNLTNFNAIWKLTSPLDPRCGWAKQPKVYCDTGICSLESTTYPFLLCIATVGSLLNIIVFAKERPKVAKGVYLMVMASADCGYMWGSFLVYLKTSTEEQSDVFKKIYSNLRGFSWYMQEVCACTSDCLSGKIYYKAEQDFRSLRRLVMILPRLRGCVLFDQHQTQ
ncbi:uncharacterized protein LOC129588481 [Paramacrobiotus metropolitanus]|uniref:uncharacterized protein LOC129588481 n=1 Tax=Paramacrobiotus metropolitanus TaxID=2943436 RepID=UPI0024456CC9|nr:uncharacterized protein LOC129588481 [Paramacrobiotus metropolitanus]